MFLDEFGTQHGQNRSERPSCLEETRNLPNREISKCKSLAARYTPTVHTSTTVAGRSFQILGLYATTTLIKCI